MANEQNLIPLNKRDKDSAKKIQSMGGKASQAAARTRKTLKEQMNMLLDLPVCDTKVFNKMSAFGIDLTDIDNTTRLVYVLYIKAMTGDVAAIKEIRNLIGEDSSTDVLKKLDDMLAAVSEDES